MSRDSEFTLDASKVTAALGQLANRVAPSGARALFQEAQIEKTESMKRTPFEFGALRASHTVSQPVNRGDTIEVVISVGGVSAPYAVFVHENLEAFHSHGQAKFLESTVRESAPYMAARIAARMQLKDI